MIMLIKNAYTILGDDERELQNILIEKDKILDIKVDLKRKSYSPNKEAAWQNAALTDVCLDAAGLIVMPGLIDIHTHGCMGYDFCDGTQEALENIANYMLSQGITAFCPTSMTLPEEELARIFANAALFKERQDKGEIGGAKLLGINMEGPFIAPEKIGAQNPQYLHKPDIAMFERLQKAAKGLIKIVTIAPELEGAMEFIDELHDEVHISIGHTNASYEIAMEAFYLGADHVTHMFNAMSSFNHREPGVVGAALDYRNIAAELICDGIHLHPATITFANRLFNDEHCEGLPVFISDSMEATGLADGQYELGKLPVTKLGNKATLTGTDTIAGSVTNLMECLRWTVNNTSLTLREGIRACTYTPALSLGMSSSYGSMGQGKYADLLLVDESLNIKHIIQNGKVIQ